MKQLKSANGTIWNWRHKEPQIIFFCLNCRFVRQSGRLLKELWAGSRLTVGSKENHNPDLPALSSSLTPLKWINIFLSFYLPSCGVWIKPVKIKCWQHLNVSSAVPPLFVFAGRFVSGPVPLWQLRVWGDLHVGRGGSGASGGRHHNRLHPHQQQHHPPHRELRLRHQQHRKFKSSVVCLFLLRLKLHSL